MRRLRRHVLTLRRGAPDGQQGITILEVLVALALFGLITLTAFVVFNISFRGLLAGRGFADEHQNARVVLEWMTRRIRLAGVGTLPGTVPWVTDASATSVAFLADTDGDGSDGVEEHRFCYDASQGLLLEEVTESPPTSATCTTAGNSITSGGTGSIRPLRIADVTFTYFDGFDEPLTPLPGELAAIRRVRITLCLDSNRSGGACESSDLTLRMDAVVRTENW